MAHSSVAMMFERAGVGGAHALRAGHNVPIIFDYLMLIQPMHVHCRGHLSHAS